MKIHYEYEIGDFVELPLEETGTIVYIDTNRLDWHPYKVKIRKATLNKTNQILEFKHEQLKPSFENAIIEERWELDHQVIKTIEHEVKTPRKQILPGPPASTET